MNLVIPFEIIYKEEPLHVQPRKIGLDTVFIVHFPSRRPPMMLTKAQKHGGKAFWTIVPEERDRSRQDAVLAEASILGNLITEYYSTSLTGDVSKKYG